MKNVNVRGSVQLSIVDPTTGRILQAYPEHRNLFTYEGADILSKLLAGKPEFTPNMVYVEFKNGESVVAPSPVREEGRSYYAGLEVTGPALDLDYLRIPLLATPQLESSDEALYASNRTRWVFMTSGDIGVSGLEFSSGVGSLVYGFALVSAPDVNDRTKDLVFARFYPAVALPKSSNSEIQARWTYTLV